MKPPYPVGRERKYFDSVEFPFYGDEVRSSYSLRTKVGSSGVCSTHRDCDTCSTGFVSSLHQLKRYQRK